MKTNSFKLFAFGLLTFISLGAGMCSKSDDATPTPPNTNTGTTGTICQLSTVSVSDGSSVSYTYSNGKWNNITVSDGKKSQTFSIDYVDGLPNIIRNKAIGALTLFTNYTKDNNLSAVNTTIDKLDDIVIVGQTATVTKYRADVTFEWKNNLLVRLNAKTSMLINGDASNPFTEDVYYTYEYNGQGDLIKMNTYNNEDIIDPNSIAGQLVGSTKGSTGYFTYEYESNIPETIESTGLTNLSMDIASDGQILFTPKSKKAVKKTTFFADGLDPILSTYTNTVNSSGFLSTTKSSGETTTYSYNNCK